MENYRFLALWLHVELIPPLNVQHHQRVGDSRQKIKSLLYWLFHIAKAEDESLI